jgi:hypothetical protein
LPPQVVRAVNSVLDVLDKVADAISGQSGKRAA